MNLGILFAAVMLASTVGACAQESMDLPLARLLSDESTRRIAVAEIVAAGGGKTATLLSWTWNPPDQVDKYGLYVGLADAFGQLRAIEAIPFLIKNISLDRTQAVNTWLKTPKVIQERLASVAALVEIGPEACTPLIKASWGPMAPEDRRAAIFAVARTCSGAKSEQAREFLSSAQAEAKMDGYWAEEGLKALDTSGAPAK